MSTDQDPQAAPAQSPPARDDDSSGNPPGPRRNASLGFLAVAAVVLLGSGVTLLAVDSCAQTPEAQQQPASQPKSPLTATSATPPPPTHTPPSSTRIPPPAT
jgi:hypothetical protein